LDPFTAETSPSVTKEGTKPYPSSSSLSTLNKSPSATFTPAPSR